MTTDYDQIADIYKETKRSPLRAYVDEYTFLKVLGNVRDKSVLDLACGYGHYSRLIKQQGAARVIGVDVSEALVKQARAIEQQQPLGIEYRVQDVASLGQVAEFDVVSAVYLFPYASTREMLLSMCRAIYTNLKPGGRLLSATLNPNVTDADLPVYRQYGVNLAASGGLKDGTSIMARLDTPEGSVELSGYYWALRSYENTLREARFRKIIWHSMRVSEVGLQKYGLEYWQPYLAKPVDTVLECYK